MKITISRKILNAFRRQCREAYPLELMAVLHGTRTEDGVIITDIKPIPHVATPDQIKNIPSHVMQRSKIKALASGADWLGTIHSHPHTPECETCWHPSATDQKSAIKDGETIMGIVYVYSGGTRTEVHWYVPASPPIVELI